jgi:uncharacterized protein YbjT (DUF2867 family)
MDKKVIAIFGATGSQGGGLARAILSDPNSPFSVRAITRQADGPAARELARLGADVVRADLDDPESLVTALDGAYGAFCVTFFWAHFSPEKEKAHARQMAIAVKQANVQHVIWSTLEDTRKFIPITDDRMPTLMGKYKVPHFDAKGEADSYFRELGVPTTFLQTTFYWDNFIHFGMGPKRGADGKLALMLPMADKLLAGIAAEDIGKCAYGIFSKGSAFLGNTIGIAGEHLSGKEMASKMSEYLLEEVTYAPVTPAMFRSLGFPGAEDLGNMFQFYSEFNDVFIKVRNVKFSRLLNPSLVSFESWLKVNAGKMPLS